MEWIHVAADKGYLVYSKSPSANIRIFPVEVLYILMLHSL
jgi:hypothetical protein